VTGSRPLPAAQARAAETLVVVNGIRRITRALRLAAGATQAQSGISAAQLFVLRQLAEGSGMSISALAARTLTDRSSVAAVVDRLVERGLARRGVSAADRRRAEVAITPRGRQLLESAPPAPTSLLTAALTRLADTELHALADSVDRLVGAMGLGATPAVMLFEEDSPAGNGA
jgi:DNA-binding MarR family transcriptional regulator